MWEANHAPAWGLCMSGNFQAIDSEEEQFQDRSPGESENNFIKACDSEAKEEPLETGSGGMPGRSAQCPLLSCVHVLLRLLEFRREEEKHTLEEGGRVGMLKEEHSMVSFVLRVLSIFYRWQL